MAKAADHALGYEKLGNVLYGEAEYVFLGRDIMRGKEYSEQTAQEIDKRSQTNHQRRVSHGRNWIDTNRDKLEMIAKSALLEFETLDGNGRENCPHWHFTPPQKPTDAGPMMGARRRCTVARNRRRRLRRRVCRVWRPHRQPAKIQLPSPTASE